MKTKGRRQSKNIIDMRPGKSGDPMFETARRMAKNDQDYGRHQRMKRTIERLKDSVDAIKKHREKKKKK